MTMNNNDGRKYELAFIHPSNLFTLECAYFTQRELLMIMKHLKNRNNHLYSKIRHLIERIDKAEKRNTDFEAYVPKTPVISTK